jgi:hypothetical protein
MKLRAMCVQRPIVASDAAPRQAGGALAEKMEGEYKQVDLIWFRVLHHECMKTILELLKVTATCVYVPHHSKHSTTPGSKRHKLAARVPVHKSGTGPTAVACQYKVVACPDAQVATRQTQTETIR